MNPSKSIFAKYELPLFFLLLCNIHGIGILDCTCDCVEIKIQTGLKKTLKWSNDSSAVFHGWRWSIFIRTFADKTIWRNPLR